MITVDEDASRLHEDLEIENLDLRRRCSRLIGQALSLIAGTLSMNGDESASDTRVC
jgi:hypothetical protein